MMIKNKIEKKSPLFSPNLAIKLLKTRRNVMYSKNNIIIKSQLSLIPVKEKRYIIPVIIKFEQWVNKEMLLLPNNPSTEPTIYHSSPYISF